MLLWNFTLFPKTLILPEAFSLVTSLHVTLVLNSFCFSLNFCPEAPEALICPRSLTLRPL